MKVKTSDLTGTALDWAVAKCVGWTWHTGISSWFGNQPWLEFSLGTQPWVNGRSFEAVKRRQLHDLAFSTNWAQGGPIIASMKEYCQDKDGDECYCSTPSVAEDWHTHPVKGTGPTPLIAAMRCYVASKLGDEIDIPKELT